MSINTETPRLNALGQVLLGSISSFLINGAIHPISTVQTCMIANSLSIFRENIHFLSLYRGYWAMCTTDAAAFAAAYAVEDISKSHFSLLAASALSGIVCTPIVCLGEGLARNRQVYGMPYLAIFKRTMRFSGLVATASREVPFTIAAFWLTPFLQKRLSMGSGIFNQVAAGSIAGAISGFATSPCELIKTRVQTSVEPLTAINAARMIYAERGWRGFFKGGGARTLYMGLAVVGMSGVKNFAPYYLPKDLQLKT